MANVNQFILGVLVLQLYVNAAPSDVSKIEDIVEIKQEDPKPDFGPRVVENDSSIQTQRQKRWFNPYGYGFPPISPLGYPSYNKRDESANTGNYAYDDPFTQIHRRLQEIAAVVRQPPPPPPPHIPIFYPVLFVPTLNCGCDENTTNKPQTSTEESIDTTPAVTGRWPEMEDERQNWGFIVNDTESDDDVDYSRPISFDPIKPDRPMNRPPPPVEHGSVQIGAENSTQSTTTTVNPLPNPQSGNEVDSSPINACDRAILSCCHQLHVLYDCFANQGCPDFTSYGSPCDSQVILRIIGKFGKYYGQTAG